MSEPTTTEAPTEAEQSESAELGDAGKRALVAEREARKAAEKSAAEYAAKLKELETANLSDLEKAQAAAKEYEAAAAKATAEALRWRVAAKHGISDEDAEAFLTGADEASITRQAERLAALKGGTPAGPRADLTQGSGRETPKGSPESDFANFLTQQLAGS